MPTEHVTIEEIESQPTALEAVLESLGEVESDLVETLSTDSTFCLIGCGTSYYLAQSGAPS